MENGGDTELPTSKVQIPIMTPLQEGSDFITDERHTAEGDAHWKIQQVCGGTFGRCRPIFFIDERQVYNWLLL
jgi:hypothetical protein